MHENNLPSLSIQGGFFVFWTEVACYLCGRAKPAFAKAPIPNLHTTLRDSFISRRFYTDLFAQILHRKIYAKFVRNPTWVYV
jgi:hypothetical protein